MRKFFSSLFGALVLLAVPAWGQECRDIKTPLSQQVKVNTPGYVPVAIVIEIPVEEGTESHSVAHKSDFRFWMHASGKGVRLNRGMELQWAKVCSGITLESNHTWLSGEMLLFNVRAHVVETYVDDHSYALRTGVFLPKELVAKQPAAGTTLDSKLRYRGVWEKFNGVALLRLIPE